MSKVIQNGHASFSPVHGDLLKKDAKKLIALKTRDEKIAAMLMLTQRSALCIILPVIFGFRHVEGSQSHDINWHVGIYNCSSLELNQKLHSPQYQDTDHPLCSKLCLKERCSCSVYVPCGNETGWQAAYRGRGPSVHNATAAALIDRVQIGKPLLLEVSGYLADLPWQHTGVPDLSQENLSTVFVKFSGNSGPQCLHNMSVMANGDFTCYIEAIFPSAGLYNLNVTMANSISTHSTRWEIRACPSGAEYLNLMLSERDQDILSCASLAGDRGQEKASSNSAHHHKRAVWIYSDKRAYATETDITFVAITEKVNPVNFHWQFGDGPAIKTTFNTFTKRYHLPDKYNVTVTVSDGLSSISSDAYPVVIQRVVRANRLFYSPSVLSNSSVSFTCRISTATDVSYRWNFGDGTVRDGLSTEQHVFNRTGEYIVEVIVSNLVSSAHLKGYIFVVEEFCQPPPVKNMGPNKIQVWRYQSVRLAVTFEAQIECNISRGLLYKWTLNDMSRGEVLLPHIETEGHYIELPNYFLHYGTYRAIAKVQVADNVVYSNYSVIIEVIPSHPVSVISEATNIFINRQSGTIITLDGQRSHDPDYPNNTISYSWSCRPINTKESNCFNMNILTTSEVLKFPAQALKPGFDLLKITLTVYSGHRSSSAEMFITVSSKPVSNIHLSCKQCQENSVNWNEEFSVSALYEECGFGPKNVTFDWKLYLVNATSQIVSEVPFCSSVDLGSLSKMEESLNISQQPVRTAYSPAHLTELSALASLSPYLLSNDSDMTTALVTQDTSNSVIRKTPHDINVHAVTEQPHRNTFKHAGSLSMTTPHPLVHLSFSEEGESSGGHWQYEGSLPPPDRVSITDVISDLDTEEMIYPEIIESPSDNQLNLPEYDYYNFGIEEADPGVPVGRPTGTDSGGFKWNGYTFSNSHGGDNLVDPNLLNQAVTERTLLDLNRELVQSAVFESYTLTGLPSWVVTFKPFMLKPKSLYMLEVSASSEEQLQGRSQMFFQTQAAPEGISCQVQPNTGSEIHTHFSIFCASGKEDLLYQYSFSVGDAPRRLLYEGRDFQHYFNLPSGDPNNVYKVTIYTEIKNRFGTATKPCPVTVTVMPSFQKNASSQLSPDLELYIYGVGNLSSLSKIGSSRDIINYISLLTAVMNRLILDHESSVDLLTLTRTALISVVCQLTITDQGILSEIIHMLTDLIRTSSQVTLDSAKEVTKLVQDISPSSQESKLPAGLILDIGTENYLVSLLSGVLEAPVLSSRPGAHLINTALNSITDLVLRCVLSRNAQRYNLSTGFMELLAWKHDCSHTVVKTLGLTTFHLTDFLEMQFQQWSSNIQHKPCVITWLTAYKRSPFHGARAPMQFSGNTADIRLFNCTTRKEIKVRRLSTPVTIEFQRTTERNHAEFTLLRSQVNTHHFNVTSQILQKAVQITVQFSRPADRPFPILLLLRMYEKPTPGLYYKQKIYHWKEQTAQFFLPPSTLHAVGTVYLMLLNADYNKSIYNKYIANTVNYTLSIESVQCLSWDGVKEWKPTGCSPYGGVFPNRISCSCNHLASVTVSHQNIISSCNSTDVSQFVLSETNYILIIVSVIFLALHAVVLVICKHADVRMQKTTGSFLLPENNPSDQFLYAITIHTGFRSGTRMTAKVHIVLYGEDGVSQTRELSSPDSKLFTFNSTNTFILSTPESLGRVWKVHLWHDNGGSSPSCYLSHVIVRDLVHGSCWFFLGQCWLAVDEGDGKVERNLIVSECSLRFQQFLYLKLTEYLVNFHPWLSVYSCPSGSSYTHTQRFSVCALLLHGYMCVNAMLIYLLEEQHFVEMGFIDVSPVSMVTGLFSVLAVMPVGSLVSLVFRVSKTNISKNVSGEQYKVKVPDVYSVEDHHDALLMNGCAFESHLSRNTVSHWTRGLQKKECKSGIQDWKIFDSVSTSKLQEDPDSILEIAEDSVSDVNNGLHDNNKQNQSDFRSPTPADIPEGQKVCIGTISSLQWWCYYVGWTLCLLLSLTCILITGSLGMKFNKTKSLLWVHSVFLSLVCCGFVLHPVMILMIAFMVSLLNREKTDWFHSPSVREPVTELLRVKSRNALLNPNQQPQERITHFEKVLAVRQRARYLRLVRPPNWRELKSVRGQIKKRTLLRKTARDLILHLIMLSLILFVTYGKSTSNHKYQLNQAIKTHFTKGPQNSFYSIQTHDNWWNWTSTTFLEKLYQNANCSDKKKGDFSGAYSFIGSPVIRKIEMTHNASCQILNLLDNNTKCSIVHSSVDADSIFTGSDDEFVSERHSICGKLGCSEGKAVTVSLGNTRSKVIKSIKKILATGWMGPNTQTVMVQFILYNAASNLFTSVTILAQKTPAGSLKPSISVQATRLHHCPGALDYCVMTSELLFFLFVVFHCYWQIYVMTQSRWLYWRDLQHWLEVTIIICSLLRYTFSVYQLTLKTEMINLLQRENFKFYVDLRPIISCEQISQMLLGIVVSCLLLKCLFLLQLNKAVSAAVSILKLIFSNLLCLLVPGVILAVALSSLWTLILYSFPSSLSNISTSFHSVFTLSFSMSSFSELYHQIQAPMALYFGALFCTMIPLKAMAICTLTFFAKQKKRTKKRKHQITIFELMVCVRDMALLFIGRDSHKLTGHHVHTNSFYLAEFEDLVDELLFHLSTMSDSDHSTLPAKKNLSETQRTFSFPISQHGLDSESAAFDVICVNNQTHKFEKIKQGGFMDTSSLSLSSYKGNPLSSISECRLPLHLQQSQGIIQERSHSKELKDFGDHNKEHFRESEKNGKTHLNFQSKPTNCVQAEWRGIVSSKTSKLSDPAGTRDDHGRAKKSQDPKQTQRNPVQTSLPCDGIRTYAAHCQASEQSNMFDVLPTEGVKSYYVEEHTIIPGYIDQCL